MTDCGINKSTVTVNSAIISGALPGVPGPTGATSYPEITETYVIENPQLAGRRYLTFANLASTITKVVILHEGTDPSSTLNLAHGTNYQGVGTALFSTAVTGTSRTTGDHYPSTQAFAAGAEQVAATSHIWADLTAASVSTTRIIINITRTAVPASTAGSVGILVEDSGSGQGYLPLIDLP